MKTFKEFINEAPSLDPTISRAGMNVSPIHPYMKQSVIDGTAKRIRGDFYTIEDPIQQMYIYYRFVGGEVQEYSMIVSDIHRATSKGSSGSAKTIISFMKMHINRFGVLYTDQDNTPGSRNLWINFIKSRPKGVKFRVIGLPQQDEITHKNIDSMSDKIWSSPKILIQAVKN